MGNRLLDWFSVVMAEAKRRRTHNKGKGILHGSVFQQHQPLSMWRET
jgi:hypothetical protein